MGETNSSNNVFLRKQIFEGTAYRNQEKPREYSPRALPGYRPCLYIINVCHAIITPSSQVFPILAEFHVSYLRFMIQHMGHLYIEFLFNLVVEFDRPFAPLGAWIRIDSQFGQLWRRGKDDILRSGDHGSGGGMGGLRGLKLSNQSHTSSSGAMSTGCIRRPPRAGFFERFKLKDVLGWYTRGSLYSFQLRRGNNSSMTAPSCRTASRTNEWCTNIQFRLGDYYKRRSDISTMLM